MPRQLGLPEALARWGLSVELYPGWDTRGDTGFNPGGAVCHWTAGPRGTTGRPSLGVVVNGRTDLPGPLCNVYLDRNGVAVVVAAGRANHAGSGGWGGLVGNSSVFGTEAECGGDGDWTAAQRWAYPRVNAAYMWLLGRGAGFVCGHNEWAPTRKIDIRDWPMSAMRDSVAALLASGGVEDDMYDADAEARLNARLDAVLTAANSAKAQASEAAAAAELSATRAKEATSAATRATRVAQQAVDLGLVALELGTATSEEERAARAVVLSRLADLRARLPRVTTARYDRPGVSTYQELANKVDAGALTYFDLSGALTAAAGAPAIDTTALAREVAAALPVAELTPAMPMSGTWTAS